MKKYYWLLLPIGMIVVGQTLAKFGVQELLETDQIVNIFIVAGYSLLILRGLVWFWIIRNLKLSLAYPFVSLTYVFILIVSHYIFHEPVTMKQVMGSFLLVGGTFCIGLGEFKRIEDGQ